MKLPYGINCCSFTELSQIIENQGIDPILESFRIDESLVELIVKCFFWAQLELSFQSRQVGKL